MSSSLQQEFNAPKTHLTVFHLYEMHDAAKNGDVATLATLLKLGMGVDAPTRWGTTPLLVAAQAGQAECVKLLISHHANLNATNKTTLTPLMLAEREGHKECAALLRAAGCDINAKTFYGYTAADFARDKSAPASTAKKGPGTLRF